MGAQVDDQELIRRAQEVVNPRQLSATVSVASVGSALVTDQGNVYVGVCVDTACSLGFCAEHNAIGSMITQGESRIVAIVAINREGKVLSPCGRCRELLAQIDRGNMDTRIILQDGRSARLSALLPEHWLQS